MKPPPFDYLPARTLGEAVDALARAEAGAAAGAGTGGKVLAGGQSLIPLLNMRLAAPGVLVDINRLTELDTVDVSPAGVRIGALARHSRVERSAEAAGAQPLLGQALRHVAHPVVRNRGTVVGSLAHADPAAELPAVLALLGGEVEAVSVAARRAVPAAEFFTGPLETGLRDAELAVSAFFPALRPASGTAFVETARRHGDYALVGVAALVTVDTGHRVTDARAALIGVAAVPLVLDLTGPALGVRPGLAADQDRWAAVAADVRDRVDPEADIHAGAAYRRHLAGVLTVRAFEAAGRRAVAALTASPTDPEPERDPEPEPVPAPGTGTGTDPIGSGDRAWDGTANGSVEGTGWPHAG